MGLQNQPTPLQELMFLRGETDTGSIQDCCFVQSIGMTSPVEFNEQATRSEFADIFGRMG